MRENRTSGSVRGSRQAFHFKYDERSVETVYSTAMMIKEIERTSNSIQVCIATMGKREKDISLLDKMNIQCDAIIGNQTSFNSIVDFDYNGYKIKCISTNETGVGLNRNNAWMRCTADIIIFADDDMIYEDGYQEKVLQYFNDNPKADVIIFNINEVVGKRKINTKKKFTKKFFYGAVRIAIRRYKAQMHGISFNLNFGGGTDFTRGEDSLFIASCIKNGLKVLVVPDFIATLTEERPSTWFKGFNDDFYFDTGVLWAASNLSFKNLRLLKMLILKKDKDIIKKMRLIKKGIEYYKNL